YKTNINGMGVYYTRSNSSGMEVGSTGADIVLVPEVNMNLIKLNNSTISGVLDASTLPVVSFYATESSSGAFNSSAVQITKMAFRGTVSYVVPSCSAQDKDIWLGEYTTGDFTGNSTTPWVDASIVLTCDATFRNAYNNVSDSYITGNITTTTRPDNYYSVSLESVNGFVDSSRGIMALDSGGATGLGVQISRSRSEQAWSSLAWIGENKAGANTINIPLYARYIQTDSNVSAGQANSKLLYTVQYK
ncbi:fimbrial protein, partial [Klebsiella oxytoca]|uniref:fimbrial protein n=1 Tax=Klebsiella oxytoca TaxID=571 RepID=UPI0018A9B7F2